MSVRSTFGRKNFTIYFYGTYILETFISLYRPNIFINLKSVIVIVLIYNILYEYCINNCYCINLQAEPKVISGRWNWVCVKVII